MFEKNNIKYNPVSAPVSGVDEQLRKEELKELSASGDPQPLKEIPNEKKVIFNKFGLKISR